jgi:hypothetical protein
VPDYEYRPGLLHCGMCGRFHMRKDFIQHPDRPNAMICPRSAHGIRPLTVAEVAESTRLLTSLFGSDPRPYGDGQ